MSTILALRYINKSVKYTSSLEKCLGLLQSQRNFLPATKSYVTESKINTKKTTDNVNDEWRTLYHLPLIPLASAFNRVKIPYGILNSIAIPAAFALEQFNFFPPPTALLVSAIGLTSWCTLAIGSLFVRNLIGKVYINDNNDKLKLAYVDYWGKRRDVLVNLNDVIPESEKRKPSKVDFYQSLCLYSDDTVKYKLLTRFGRIDDLETFVAIFGD